MDYITDELNENIEISETNSYSYVTYLRARIEYSLFFILGYLWNKNSRQISQDNLHNIMQKLNRISIGEVIEAIRVLDIDKEIITKKVNQVFEQYPKIRNSKIGHGYAPGEQIVNSLSDCYEKMIVSIPLLSKPATLILVEEKKEQNYLGLRMPSDKHGRKERWTCNQDNFPEEEHFPRLYFLMEGRYYKLSPFIMLLNRGRDAYVFSSLEDSLSGSVNLCPLFNSADVNYQFLELTVQNNEQNRVVSVMNNSVMNIFENNYTIYYDIGIKKMVFDFLKTNQASVTATIWGHGGVGKTACIQSVCQELFLNQNQTFAYIIFITAKDRIYNTPTGKIIENEGNFVRHYYEIIQEINKTVFNSSKDLRNLSDLEEAENRIIECKQKMLIVIDDYETFGDSEKEKISAFIKKLKIQYHKVIITTRNTRFIIGETISTNELNVEETQKFLLSIIEAEYIHHLKEIKDLLLNHTDIIQQIYKSTSGRPIFIYQFAHLFVQEGFQFSILKQLKDSEEAQNFLYGRLYEYLSPRARFLFAVISQATNSDMVFRLDVLAYLCSKCVSDKDEFDIALKELFDQRIIEHYGDSQGRIYAPELFKIMEERFVQQEDSFRSTVKNLLNSIGGKNINGSIQQALLNEADQSRINGNMEDTVSRYRRVLKTNNAPGYIRRKALLNAASYLAITCLNPEAACNIINEFLEDFQDDSQVCSQYVDYLWQLDNGKQKADLFIRKFFNRANGHKKTDPKYFNLFAKGVGYCSNYDMLYRRYENNSMRIRQYNETINEFGRILYEIVSSEKFVFGREANRHLVKVGLLQTLKLCRIIYKKNPGKMKLAEDICKFSDTCFNDAVYHNQFAGIQKEILVLKKKEEEPWKLFLEKYAVGSVVEGFVSYIKRYALFIKFDAPIRGFVHVSQVKKDENPVDLYEEYTVGQSIRVKIIDIDNDKKRIQMQEI